MSDIECKHSECWLSIGMKSSNECWHCTHNTSPNEHHPRDKREDKFITHVEKITELLTYMVEKQKLTKRAAFNVIHYLQEWTCCLPDTIEQCDDCLDLFDSNSEGYHLDNQYTLDGEPLPEKYHGHWCDGCVPNVDFKCP